MSDDVTQDPTMTAWLDELRARLDLSGLDLDVEAVLDVAAVVAHSVLRPAAPLSTFLAGYAAGIAAGPASAASLQASVSEDERATTPDAAIAAALASTTAAAEAFASS